MHTIILYYTNRSAAIFTEMTSSLLIYTVLIILFSTFSCIPASINAEDDYVKTFIQCLQDHSDNSNTMSEVIYTPKNSSYTLILQYTINNLRFMTPETPKPLVIVTPVNILQIQTVILCSKKHGMQIRIRSGGHDFEGQSYVAKVPFVLLDIINHHSVEVHIKNGTAWVESGATIGEVYYKIAEKSKTFGFPGGIWTSVGIGGFISGGGYGMMLRKYGLAADNVIDARFIDANGTLLDRKAMGEDLFWCLRGGGGSSFGVIHSWKIILVPVPKIVTVFRILRTLEENATSIFQRWQHVAPTFPEDINLKCYAQSVVSNASTRKDGKTIRITFEALYLGRKDGLLLLIQKAFPELGLKTEDCSEISWIESGPFFSEFPVGTPPEVLLNRTLLPKYNFKGKSDFSRNIIPEHAILGLWKMLFKVPPLAAIIQFTPFGGKMNEISPFAIPFPHRAGTLYMIYMGVAMETNATKHLNWINSLYEYLTPYVSKNPRAAYVNYLDLDLGVNALNGSSNYAEASIWGEKYFDYNFYKLAQVKSVVDPDNFFRHEQSIPAIS